MIDSEPKSLVLTQDSSFKALVLGLRINNEIKSKSFLDLNHFCVLFIVGSILEKGRML